MVVIRLNIDNQYYDIEIDSSQQMDVTLQVSDVATPTTKSQGFSRDLSVPAKGQNDIIIKHLKDLTNWNIYDNKKIVKCQILQDGLVYGKEFNFQVKSYQDDYYVCNVFDNLAGFFDVIKDKTFADLNFQDSIHNYNLSGISQSWTNDWSSGYYYGMADWDLPIVQADFPFVSLDRFKQMVNPQVYLKYILKKIFNQNGYQMNSKTFDNEMMERIVIGGSKIASGDTVDSTYRYNNSFNVGTQSVLSIPITGTPSSNGYTQSRFVNPDGSFSTGGYLHSGGKLALTDNINYPYGDPSGSYDTTLFQYENNSIYKKNIQFNCILDYKFYDVAWGDKYYSGSTYGLGGGSIPAFNGSNASNWFGNYNFQTGERFYLGFKMRRSHNKYGQLENNLTIPLANANPFTHNNLLYLSGLNLNPVENNNFTYKLNGGFAVNTDGTLLSSIPGNLQNNTNNQYIAEYAFTIDNEMIERYSGTSSYNQNEAYIRFEGNLQSVQLNDPSSDTNYPLFPDEKVWVEVFYSYYDGGNNQVTNSLKLWETNYGHKPVEFQKNTSFYCTLLDQTNDGYERTVANIIPPDTKIQDFISDIVNMFNIYIDNDQDSDNSIIFDTYSDYYSRGVLRDYTDLIDTSSLEIDFIIDNTNKTYSFKYKDSDDLLSTSYLNSWGTTYGSYIYNTENNYASDDKAIELKLFAPSPLSTIGWEANNPLNPFIMPTYYNSDVSATGLYSDKNLRINFRTDKNVDGGLERRINPITSATTTQISIASPQGIGLSISTIDGYPYMGHFDNAVDPNNDLNFGQTIQLFYTFNNWTDNNLVNIFWKDYLTEISSNRSALVKVKANLNAHYIHNLKLYDRIQISNLKEQSTVNYFKINKITYDPINPWLADLELILDFQDINLDVKNFKKPPPSINHNWTPIGPNVPYLTAVTHTFTGNTSVFTGVTVPPTVTGIGGTRPYKPFTPFTGGAVLPITSGITGVLTGFTFNPGRPMGGNTGIIDIGGVTTFKPVIPRVPLLTGVTLYTGTNIIDAVKPFNKPNIGILNIGTRNVIDLSNITSKLKLDETGMLKQVDTNVTLLSTSNSFVGGDISNITVIGSDNVNIQGNNDNVNVIGGNNVNVPNGLGNVTSIGGTNTTIRDSGTFINGVKQYLSPINIISAGYNEVLPDNLDWYNLSITNYINAGRNAVLRVNGYNPIINMLKIGVNYINAGNNQII